MAVISYPLLLTRRSHWKCCACSPNKAGYRFSVLINTIFENTNVGLCRWFKVIYLMVVCKSVSSLQIQRIMGFGSYKTALYITHRNMTHFVFTPCWPIPTSTS
jgi:hypothetical protein